MAVNRVSKPVSIKKHCIVCNSSNTDTEFIGMLDEPDKIWFTRCLECCTNYFTKAQRIIYEEKEARKKRQSQRDT